MDAILAVWCLFFGTDINDLGSGSFRDREAASSRLRAAGLRAIPALRAGMLDASPERQMRCELLLDETGWNADRSVADNLLWLRCKPAIAIFVVTSRREAGDYSQATQEPLEPFLARVAENRAVCRQVYEVAKACGIQFNDPRSQKSEALSVERFLTLTACERYWLLWDFGNCAKPTVPVRQEDVPRQMEKP